MPQNIRGQDRSSSDQALGRLGKFELSVAVLKMLRVFVLSNLVFTHMSINIQIDTLDIQC